MIAIRKFAVAGATFAVMPAGAIVIQNSGAGTSLVGKSSGGEPFPFPKVSSRQTGNSRCGWPR